MSAAQRAAVIDGIRRQIDIPGALENLPDEHLMPILHCLTGRTADLVRTVTATANRLHN